MPHQSEQKLENNLIKQLATLGYEKIKVADEEELEANLKIQIEKHNKIKLTDKEFAKVLNHLGKGGVFERAKILRDRMKLRREDGKDIYIEFLDQDQWCKNIFQVAQQVTVEGSYKNRYDVTLLVNGLPLVQVELKRRGLELKEAFNQTNRYQRHSYGAGHGLFQYIQFFVISNGVNTKYYANNRKQSFKQTFYWSDDKNKAITRLKDFTNIFLEPCHMAKMIVKYTVLNETGKYLMILRPYQYYAVEKIVERLEKSEKHGYIWHTTGSGKTLTSFKTSQILSAMPEVKKVIFVVDRKDLDYQTSKEFNSFAKGSIDATDNTRMLVKQLGDDTKLIVTTIQKLNSAITREKYTSKIGSIKDEKVVFIFDECHRSQFGDTHNRIRKFFTKHQLFGFTGTPIFADNAAKNQFGVRTTKDLFDEQLHNYVITDAIKDENVLKFSVEYVGRYKEKDTKNNIDIDVEEIDIKELLESEERLDKITDYVIANHNRKTHAREFTGMMCVSSVDAVTKYYDLFKKKREAGEHNLRVATIFSYTANEEDKDADGLVDEPLDLSEGVKVNAHTRDKLESYIQDYNKEFGTSFTTKDSKSFYNYYNDIAKRVKSRKIDILLVVNMFLTGFDSKSLNTMYVDKNLRHHGLIQAFSRTNRILNEQKSQGNIVCFRNLKKRTDEAIALFSNKDAKETILVAPYETYVGRFNEAYDVLLQIAPTVDSVNDLADEEVEFKFVQAFRELMRLQNAMSGFADFTFEDTAMEEQMFEDYKSKYLDIYDKVRLGVEKERVSILEDVDFMLELIHRDDINVTYILGLLADLVDASPEEREKKRKKIVDILSGDAELRSKRELIMKFIDDNLPNIHDSELISEKFSEFWTAERKIAFDIMCNELGLASEKVESVIGRFLFTDREPLNDEIVELLNKQPTILERKGIVQNVRGKVIDFVRVFISGAPSDLN
jgi:type I restriction enzyme, R subunit